MNVYVMYNNKNEMMVRAFSSSSRNLTDLAFFLNVRNNPNIVFRERKKCKKLELLCFYEIF